MAHSNADNPIDQFVKTVGEWLSSTGPKSEVVISSRIRLARNLHGYKFMSKCEADEKAEIAGVLETAVLNSPARRSVKYLTLDDMAELDRQTLVERHLISKNLADSEGPRGVAIDPTERLAIMVNEEDHLRIQVFRSGLELDDAWQEINAIDDNIEKQVGYAYSPRFGYMTACPTNVGTGLRVSVMLHLPALKLTGEIEKVFRTARELRLAVRGMYGEGTDSTGDFYQISNQTSLGKSEREIIDEFKTNVIPQVIDYERAARKLLLDERQVALDDKVWRALGTLKYARALSSDEILGYLSHLRMGVYLERLDAPDIRTLNELLLMSQPAHLQKREGSKLNGEQRSIERANLVRQRLEGVG